MKVDFTTGIMIDNDRYFPVISPRRAKSDLLYISAS